MTDDSSPKSWQQQPDEPPVWYNRFHNYLTLGPSQIGFGGARVPGLKAFYLSLSARQAREQSDDLRRIVLRRVPHHYIRSESLVTIPNESRIVIGKKIMLQQSRKSSNPAYLDSDSFFPNV